jgi:hypothetical protein
MPVPFRSINPQTNQTCHAGSWLDRVNSDIVPLVPLVGHLKPRSNEGGVYDVLLWAKYLRLCSFLVPLLLPPSQAPPTPRPSILLLGLSSVVILHAPLAIIIDERATRRLLASAATEEPSMRRRGRLLAASETTAEEEEHRREKHGKPGPPREAKRVFSNLRSHASAVESVARFDEGDAAAC